MPSARIAHKLVLVQHPVLTGLHAETSIVDEQDKISPFPISPFQPLEIVFVFGWSGDKSVQAKLYGHTAGLKDD